MVYYRISDNSYQKTKPPYINNEICLRNFLYVFKDKEDIFVIIDSATQDTIDLVTKYDLPHEVTTFGNGAATFNLALDMALKISEDEIVYFVEDDFLHRPNSDIVLIDGFDFADYVSLYDHPDKYDSLGPNPNVVKGAENTRVYRGLECYWKETSSTTMTFAAEVKTLKEDEEILRKHTNAAHPNDFEMFDELRSKGRTLVTPLPSYSTHGEIQWLAPFIRWDVLASYQL
jgi:hypothetical protein